MRKTGHDRSPERLLQCTRRNGRRLQVLVSTPEQAVSGLGLDAQRATIAEYADEVISAKPLSDRPGALAAIAAVEAG